VPNTGKGILATPRQFATPRPICSASLANVLHFLCDVTLDLHVVRNSRLGAALREELPLVLHRACRGSVLQQYYGLWVFGLCYLTVR
jgi:hypothetical protein